MEMCRPTLTSRRSRIFAVLPRLASLLMFGVQPASAANASRRFETVAATRSSDPTLATWVVSSDAAGTETVVMAFRRDEFILAVNLATGECRQHFLSPGMPWSLASGLDGQVYVGTSLSPGALFLRYDPKTDRVEKIAQADGEQILYWMDVSVDGMIYAGSYPGARLYRYAPATREFENLVRMDERQTYNLSGAVARDGKIYSGVGMKEQGLIEYDPVSGDRRNLWPEKWRGPSVPIAYRGYDGSIYATPGTLTPASKGKALRISAGGKVEEIALKEAAPHYRGHTLFSDAGQPVLRDGSRIAEVTREKIVLRAGVGRGQDRTIPLKFEPLVKDIYSIGVGPGGKIYGTSKPAVMFSYDPATRKMADLVKISPRVGQVYRYVDSRGKLYMGSYGHAEFHVYDPEKADVKTRTIGRAGAYQDRPVDMGVDSKGMIYAACYPGYGERGGALTYFDPRTEQFENFRNIIPQESLNALALDEAHGRIFVGTSNVGGNGTEPSSRDAEVAIWDMTRREIVARVTPVPGEKMIAGLVLVPDGWLGGMTKGGWWFALDPATLKIKVALPLSGPAPNLTRLAYDPVRKVAYGIAGKTLWRVRVGSPASVEDLGVWESKEKTVNYGVELDQFGAVYFAVGRELVQWVP